MQASAAELRRQKRSRQHDPKCRLKSSEYILMIPHRTIQLNTISFWVPEASLRLHKTTNRSDLSEARDVSAPSSTFSSLSNPFFLIHRRAVFALNQSEARFAELGEYSRSMSSEAFWAPNTASSQFVEPLEAGSRSKRSLS